MKHLMVITWARWKFYDSYDKRYFTTFTASVLRPSFEYPVASVMMSVVNAGGRVFMRFATLENLRNLFIIPEEYAERLEVAYRKAIFEAGIIQDKQKALYKMNDLSPGSKVVRTDTGEIIAEAEDIIREGQRE